MSQKSIKKNEIHNYEAFMAGVKRQIKNELSDTNSKVIFEYEKEMIRQSIAIATRQKHLRTLLGLSRLLQKDWKDVTRHDIDELVYEIMQRYADENGKESNYSYDHKKILKIFFRWLKLGSREFVEVGDPVKNSLIVENDILRMNKDLMIRNKGLQLALILGPFFLLSLTDAISDLLGFSIFAKIIHVPYLPVFVGTVLLIITTISSLFAIKKLKEIPDSIVNTLPYPAVWVSVFLVMSLTSNILYYQISLLEGVSEEFSQAMSETFDGQFFLAYVIGLMSPFCSALILNKKDLKQIFKTKHALLYPEIHKK